jgi:uncharacterized SAM-binding protein YcdF (DUF218 family)
MKKLWKIIKWVLYVVVGVLLIDLAVVVFFSVYRPPLQKADAIVVLGAAINTPALYNRTMEGLKLFNKGYAGELVLSGGVDYTGSISEAVYMQNAIVAKWENQTTNPHPIPLPEGEGDKTELPTMILDENSHSTYENLQNTKTKIGSDKSIIIVSDGFHLARAVLVAKRLGFKSVLWDSPSPSYYRPTELAYYYMREVLAMIDYLPKFIFG